MFVKMTLKLIKVKTKGNSVGFWRRGCIKLPCNFFFTIVAEDCPHEMKLWAGVAKQNLKIKGVPCWFTSNR